MKTLGVKVNEETYEKFIEVCNRDGCTTSDRLRDLVLKEIGDEKNGDDRRGIEGFDERSNDRESETFDLNII
jgi:hypothetical protein